MSFVVPSPVQQALAILRTTLGDTGSWGRGQTVEDRLAKIIAAFEAAGARWCLIGAHAVNLYTEPRATADFDFVFDDRKERKVLAALVDAFGALESVDVDAAVRLPGLNVDLVRASTNELFRAALTHATERDGWRVPPIEVLLALKYLSATSGFRARARKAQDATDLMRLYESVDEGALDRALLRELTSKIYPGAADDFDALLDKIERGEPITI